MKNTTFQTNVMEFAFLITKNEVVIEFSQPLADITGYSSEEALNRKISEILKILRVGPNVDSKNIDGRADYFFFTKYHEVRFINIEITEILDEKKYTFTEKPDTRLEEKFMLLDQVFSGNNAGVSIYSTPDLILLKANHMYLDFLDAPYNCPQDALGKHIFELVEGWRFSPAESIWRNAIMSGKPAQIKEYRHDKSKGCVAYWDDEITPIYENGKVMYIVTNTIDVTEHVKHEEILKSQRDCLFKIINTLDFPMIRLSYPDFNIIEINKKGYDFIDQILPGSKSELESLSGTNTCTALPYFQHILNYQSVNEMVSIKEPIYLKDFKITLNNKNRYISLLYQPIFDLNEEIEEFLIISTDVTDEILQKQKIEEIMKTHEEFFSYIAHEFKTPLTTISSTIQLLELIYNEEITENIRKNINIIRRSTYQQMRLVNNLLDITRAEAGYLKVNKKNLDIIAAAKVITESIYQFAKAKDIKIKFSSSLKEKIIAMDDEKFERILLNLLSNAIKFTPEGKSIDVTISSNNHKVFVKIKDEGVGIPKDKLEVIFERFGQTGNNFTRHSEGTGIGLCLVKLLIKAMDGDIKVDSTEGKGSTFTVSIPDIKVSQDEGLLMPEFTDNRLVRALNTEFCNIYSA